MTRMRLSRSSDIEVDKTLVSPSRDVRDKTGTTPPMQLYRRWLRQLCHPDHRLVMVFVSRLGFSTSLCAYHVY